MSLLQGAGKSSGKGWERPISARNGRVWKLETTIISTELDRRKPRRAGFPIPQNKDRRPVLEKLSPFGTLRRQLRQWGTRHHFLCDRSGRPTSAGHHKGDIHDPASPACYFYTCAGKPTANEVLGGTFAQGGNVPPALGAVHVRWRSRLFAVLQGSHLPIGEIGPPAQGKAHVKFGGRTIRRSVGPPSSFGGRTSP